MYRIYSFAAGGMVIYPFDQLDGALAKHLTLPTDHILLDQALGAPVVWREEGISYVAPDHAGLHPALKESISRSVRIVAP